MDVKPFTTYTDVKKRVWVVVDLDYFGIHKEFQNTIQAVKLYKVYSEQETVVLSYGEFLNHLENKLFIKS